MAEAEIKLPVMGFMDGMISTKLGSYYKARENGAISESEMKNIRDQLWVNYNKDRMARFNDASYQLTPQEVEAINSEILHVLRWDTIEPIKSIPTKNVGKGLKRWKSYVWSSVEKPAFSLEFPRTNTTAIKKTETEWTLRGYHYDYEIDMVTLDAMQNSNAVVRFGENYQSGLLTELTAQLLETSIWSLFRGGDIPGYLDDGKKGIVNHASVQDPGAMGLGADDNLTASGDYPYSVHKMATKLLTAKFAAPYELHLTPGCYAQAVVNFDSTNKIFDFELLQNDVTRGLLSRIVVNPFLIDSETEVNATGAMMLCKPGAQNFQIIESYSLGLYPLPSQGLGIEGKLLWCGGVEIRRPTSIVYCDALTNNILAA